MSVFVIGEMASAHDGELDKAKQLVDVAVAAGCDAVKVQFWSDSDQLANRRKVPQYYRDIYKQYQIPVQWLSVLRDYCGDRIEFMSTCFLPQDAKTVSPFVKRFKVSAFESGANDLLRAISAIAEDRSIITSVGKLVSVSEEIRRRHLLRKMDVFLYCVSAYPTQLGGVDLNQIRCPSDLIIGFSDHTGDLDMGAYAVCAGAKYVEAHMKLFTTDALNPDGGSFAHLPQAFKQYVRSIRKAERVGSGLRVYSDYMSPSLVNKYSVVTD